MNSDASNHFGPNRLAVEGMLLDVGFSRVVAFDPWTSSKDWGIDQRSEAVAARTAATPAAPAA